MKNVLLQSAMKLNKNRKQRKAWHRVVQVLGLLVVFCTTYALILPAITMEQETICGIEAHEHTEDCYIEQVVPQFSCQLEEGITVIHSHSELCWDEGGVKICHLPEIYEHSHDENCYAPQAVCEYVHVHSEECQAAASELVCELEEAEGHSHSEECGLAKNLICTLEEKADEGHAHGEECFTMVEIDCHIDENEEHFHTDECSMAKSLVCTLEETVIEGHSHADECFETVETECTLEETEGHAHGEECWGETVIPCELLVNEGHEHAEECYEEALVCTVPELLLHRHEEGCAAGECSLAEAVSHEHSPECYTPSDETELILVCEIEEHIHVEECYPLEEEEGPIEFICGIGLHTHIESCLGEDGGLVCTIPEHTHDASCVIEDFDLNADVESSVHWEEEINNIHLSGNWPKDVISIARSQLGYRESRRNAQLTEEGQLNGYTRYGAWYGIPYGEWCAMFSSFCINYAKVENYPLESSVDRWINDLTESGYYRKAGEYSPKPGDLIFFDYEQYKDAPVEIPIDADHVGIVQELIPATEEEPARIKTIEGNAMNKVSELTYDMDDPHIIGYGYVPAGNTIILEYFGEDYTVTASFGPEAGIPETAVLTAEEILPGSEEYTNYYNQSVAAIVSHEAGEESYDLGVSFARFFDVKFLVEGETVEPGSAVNVQISYENSIRQTAEDTGVVVHFADEGVELIEPRTSGAEDEAEKVDTFEFEQGSFSVVGTIMSRAAGTVLATTGTIVNPRDIDNTGNTFYALIAQVNGSWYALDGNDYPVAVTVRNSSVGGTVDFGNNASNNLFWSFVKGEGNYVYADISNLGSGRHLHPFYNSNSDTGLTTSGAWPCSLEVNGSSFKILGNNRYARLTGGNAKGTPVQNSNQATTFYAVRIGSFYNVWFDGTDGGMMSYYGADNLNYPVTAGADGKATVELPETWKSSTKYNYVLQGWYDVHNNVYYPVNPNDDYQPTATISGSTVFYADWKAATYDVGHQNENTVQSLDTNDFITTYVFDYNVLFNVQSQRLRSSNISAGSHSEVWEMVYGGNVAYNNARSLGFSFIDYDANGEFSYPNGRSDDDLNTNQGDEITSGVIDMVKNWSGKDIIDLLFNPNTQVIGKNYVGQGNYLFQYMDSTTPNYDGEHDGYYYLDARLNAASYNQTNQRFYLYNYLERTSDSRKDGYMNPAGQYSDFLPFNSPYLFSAAQLDPYTDSIRRPGYEFDAKDGGNNHPEYNSLDDANTNYFFGFRSDIEFFLPNDAGSRDEYGNYGNISTRGEHMVFDFHGDDDVWVFVDGELVLDIGGLHGIMYGKIDFSTGTVTSGKDGVDTVTKSFTEILGHNITEGTHTMTVYYMERGSSQSNCAIYFNIAPRYDLEIMKEDIVTRAQLNGTEFTLYTCEDCAKADGIGGRCPSHGTDFHYAQLWDSRADHEADMADDNTPNSHKHTFLVTNGVAKCWGISAGKTYYIKETEAPDGYPGTDDLIRITLNNRGTASIETTTLHGENGVMTEGYAVIEQNVNDTLKIVALTVTNETDGRHTKFRVEKEWAEGSDNMPESITVILLADGVPVNRVATLTEANGWTYTWEGLEKYRSTGTDEPIVYTAQEVLVPGFNTVYGDVTEVEAQVDWVRVADMSDSDTFLLVHNGQALSYNGSFGWMDPEAAKGDANAAKAAQWDVTTDHAGFHLKNGLGYTLTYNSQSNNFYGVQSDEVNLNQVFYFLNSRLVNQHNDIYRQFGANGSAVAQDGLAFTLYRKDVLTGYITDIENVPVETDGLTHVEVTKTWSVTNPAEYRDLSVTVNLLADGAPTGRKIVLNASNNWSGGFYELPYLNSRGQKIVYTVQEDLIVGYLPFYSDGTEIPGLPITIWEDTDRLTNGSIYRLTNGGSALTVSTAGNVFSLTGGASNLANLNQQWKAVRVGNNTYLQNLGTEMYLDRGDGTALAVTENYQEATPVRIQNGHLMIGDVYLELGSGYAQTTGNTNNITDQKLSVKSDITGMPGTYLEIENVPGGMELPNTGGLRPLLHIFGGLLLMSAAAVIYVKNFGRKRQKGGM